VVRTAVRLPAAKEAATANIASTVSSNVHNCLHHIDGTQPMVPATYFISASPQCPWSWPSIYLQLCHYAVRRPRTGVACLGTRPRQTTPMRYVNHLRSVAPLSLPTGARMSRRPRRRGRSLASGRTSRAVCLGLGRIVGFVPSTHPRTTRILPTHSVRLFLKRQCDRTLGGRISDDPIIERASQNSSRRASVDYVRDRRASLDSIAGSIDLGAPA
jgi:hypothetical protein